MIDDLDKVYALVSQQFPSFYRDEGPEFVSFVEEYYKWLETSTTTSRTINRTQYLALSAADQQYWYDYTGSQTTYRFNGGYVTQTIRSLFKIGDIDETTDLFVDQFILKYLNSVPKSILGDKRFLIKHILDIYRSKGSRQGVRLLFRLLYNESIDIYVPSVDILKPSDATWVERKYLEISYSPINVQLHNQFIRGTASGATAFVENYVKLQGVTNPSEVLYLSNIKGEFLKKERIISFDTTGDLITISQSPTVLGSARLFEILYTSKDFVVGDTLVATSTSGQGIGLKARVSTLRSSEASNGTIAFRIVAPGSGYTLNSSVVNVYTGSNTSGNNANFRVGSLGNTSIININTNYINYAPYAGANVYINAQTSVNGFNSTFILANNQFANGDLVTYNVSAGNTALSGLANGSQYYVVNATALTFQLANSFNGTAISLTPGLTQNGHFFYCNTVVSMNLSSTTFGSSLKNANVNTVLANAFSGQNVTIGSIATLAAVNPGQNYNGYVNVKVTDPLIAGYGYVDANGGILGLNATVSGNVEIGQGLARSLIVVDSGFNYEDNDTVVLTSSSNSSMYVDVKITQLGVGFEEGRWEGTKSFLNSDKYIHDNDYYQEFSYEISSSRSLDKYINVLRSTIHPAGNKVFGKVSLDQQYSNVEYGFFSEQVIPIVANGSSLGAFTLDTSIVV